MNGQRVSFGDDTVSPAYSATRAAYRIYNRSQRLGMKPDEPMGVFCNNKCKVQFIKDTLVNNLLQQAASETLGLPRSHKEIKLWSTHSIRVTAANLLYRMQLSDQFIMTRLRWNSPAYLMYLRNTIHSADAHAKAICVKLSDKDKQRASYRPKTSVEHICCATLSPFFFFSFIFPRSWHVGRLRHETHSSITPSLHSSTALHYFWTPLGGSSRM